MNWKTKAFIQNIISLLPSEMSYEAYYLLQRRFGSLKSFNPESRLLTAKEIVKFIKSAGGEVRNKVYFELGTGRVLAAPLAFWLMGAKKTITVDINPYVRPELVKESLSYISENKQKIQNLFGDLLIAERLESLIEFYHNNSFSLKEFLQLCSIEYLAPCNATRTTIPAGSVDYFVSCAVLEHIDYETIEKIILEANRFVSTQGMFVNHIDYRDHFSTHDKNITAINFLQYSDREWSKYAGNRYMYMNRLRHDDYINLFNYCGQKVILEKTEIDQRSLEILKNKIFRLDKNFIDKSPETIAASEAIIITMKV